MATYYWSCIFCITPAELPKKPMNLDDSDGEVGILIGIKSKNNKELFINTYTKGNDIADSLVDKCTEYQLEGLKYFEVEFAALDTDKIEKAIKDIEYLLEKYRKDSYPFDINIYYDELESDVDCDGGYPYLIWYLISIRKMFHHALNNGLYIIYVLVLPVVYKFNVLIVFCVSRCCTEAKRHAAPPHGFPASSKRIRFFESVGLNDSLHWH